MAAFTAPECDANVEQLNAVADEFLNLLSRITGKSGDLHELFNGSSREFSELIAQDLLTTAETNYAAWKRSLTACMFAYGVIKSWASDVEWYRREIQNLQGEWESTRESLNERMTAPEAQGRIDLELAAQHERTSTLERLNGQAIARWNELQRRARENEDLLRKGPDNAASIQALVDMGAVGWGLYNAAQNGIGMPLLAALEDNSTANAKHWAKEFANYLQGEDSQLEWQDVELLINTLGASNEQAALHATQGTHFQEFELEYQEAFFAELDKQLGYNNSDQMTDSSPAGVLRLPQALDELLDNRDSDLQQWEADEILNVVSTSILNLSNENIYPTSSDNPNEAVDRLPQSVRDIANGMPNHEHPGSHDLWRSDNPYLFYENRPGDMRSWESHSEFNARTWMTNAEHLENLLGHSDENTSAGEQFSANIITSMGHHLNAINALETRGRVDDFMDNPMGTQFDIFDSHDSPLVNDSTLGSLLDLSYRNEDVKEVVANDDHDHPIFGETANALRGLYTYDWDDGGVRVAELTDWISESAQHSDAAEQDRARDAALSVIEMLTNNDDRHDNLINTGRDITQPDGTVEHDVAMGALNPAIANSLTDMTLNYLYDFGIGTVTDFAINSDSDITYMEIPPENRVRHLEYLMADDESAARLHQATGLRDIMAARSIHDTEPTAETPNQSARLRALIDAAMRDEVLDRSRSDYQNDVENQETSQFWFNNSRTLAYAATGFLKAPVIIATGFSGAGLAAEGLNDRLFPPITPEIQSSLDGGPMGEEQHFIPISPDGQSHRDETTKIRFRLDVLDWLVQEGQISMDRVRNESPDLVVDSPEGERVIAFPEVEPGTQRDRIEMPLEYLLSCVSTSYEGAPAEETVEDLVSAYMGRYESTYWSTYEDFHNRGPITESDIEEGPRPLRRP